VTLYRLNWTLFVILAAQVAVLLWTGTFWPEAPMTAPDVTFEATDPSRDTSALVATTELPDGTRVRTVTAPVWCWDDLEAGREFCATERQAWMPRDLGPTYRPTPRPLPGFRCAEHAHEGPRAGRACLRFEGRD